MLRGINKQIIFECDMDRQKFLDTVNRYKAISNYEVLGYCLMNNHIHLLLKENDESVSTALKRICSSYVRWYNLKYERCGHLFQERFKSEVVKNDAHLLTVLRYIHQNPIKAGLSKSVVEYKWSSYKDYIRKSTLSDSDYLLTMISNNKEESIKLFIDYTNVQNNDKCMDYEVKVRLLDDDILKQFADYGIVNASELQQLDRARRNQIIIGLKANKGITIRQLARVTGLSKSLIDKI